jgi:PAS domain S-box-containing protein
VFPEISEEWKRVHQRALAGEVVRADADRFVRENGRVQWLRWEVRPWRDAAGQIGGIVVFSEDITDVTLAAEALRDSEQHFRRAAEALRRYELLARHSRDIVLFMRREDGRILEANTAAETAYGYSREELVSLSIRDLRAPGTRSLADEQMASAEADGLLFETVHQRKDGSIFPVEVSSQGATMEGVRTLISVVRDITERKRAEEALRQSEIRYQALFEKMASGFAYHRLIVDGDGRPTDYVFLEANEAFEHLTGLKRVDIIGKSVRDVIPGIEKDPADWIATYGQVVLTGRDIHFEQYSAALDKWYKVSAYSPRTGHFATVFDDITDRRRAEDTLRHANVSLTEADQRKDEFLAVLSHELRNPLTPIRNSLFVLEHAEPGSDQAKRAQDVISRQTGQLARLVDDLLDITRVSRNKIQLRCGPLELNDLVRRTVEDHRTLFERRGILVVTDLAQARLPVYGDTARLSQVVGNLLQNAAKFTPDGGRVRVATSVVASRGRAAVRVVDTGVGIEPAMLCRLFQPFMQADATLERSQGGVGLGLALVKGLVVSHGGEVFAYSDGVGRGSEFVVELPLDPTPSDHAAPVRASTAGRGRRVLIVEDNIDAADSLREALEFGDHLIEVAYSGPEGLSKAREFNPEVVLCDIGLPGMDGFAVARAFRADEVLKAAHLVALSGYALPEDLQRASEAGFERHLAKPPGLEELEQMIADLVS